MRLTTYGETARGCKNTIDSNTLSKIQRIAGDVVYSAFSGNSHILFKDRIVFLNHIDVFRILSELRVDDDDTQQKNILMSHVYQCEKKCAGSSILLLSLLAGKEIHILDSGVLDKTSLKEMISTSSIDKLENYFFKSLEYAGADSTFSIKKHTRESYISVKDSLDFPITQVKEFGEEISLSNCLLFSYDGVIERISQIERIINLCIEKKCQAVILCRGYGYEVVSTLLHNYRAKKMSIIPITLRTDWESEFIVRDISFCMGVDSATLDYENVVEKIEIKNENISIIDEKMIKKSKELFKKVSIDSSQISIDENIIRQRLKFLSSRKVELGIGQEFSSAVDILFDRIDYCNRVIIRSKSSGYSRLKIMGKKLIVPIESLYIAKKVYQSIKNSLNKTYVLRYEK